MKKFLSIMLAVIMVFSCTIIVSAEDGVTVITKQPTAYAPSVEVSNPDSVESYQWYKSSSYAEDEISNKNANTIDIGTLSDATGEIPSGIQLETINQVSSYDSTDGWTPALFSLDYSIEGAATIYVAICFFADFEADSTVSVEINADIEGEDYAVAVLLLNSETQEEYALTPDENGKFTSEVNEAGEYWLVIAANTDISKLYVKAFGTVASYEPIEGETSSALSEIAVGKNYRCVVTLKDGTVLYSNVLSANYEIVSQPTAADPSVEVTFEKDASFQWYELEESHTIVDDTMIDTESTYDSTYDPETQEWTPYYSEPSEYAGYMEYLVGLFYMYLSEGDTVRITISNPDAISPADPEFRFYNHDTDNDNYIEFVDGVLEFTAEENGLYEFYQYGISPETATYKVELVTYSGKKIEGETQKNLKSFELGKYYAVEVTYSDDTAITSDMFKMEYAITKQPTTEDPSVEVNFEEDVEGYQWYSIAYNEGEVTDEIADPAYFEGDSEGEPSYYDEENECWVGSLYGVYTDTEGDTYYEYDAFFIDLSEGQTIAIIPSEEIIDRVYVDANLDFDYDEDEYWQYEDGVYYYTAPTDGNYDFYADTYSEEVLTFKAYTTVAEVTAIEGESESVLKNAQVGLYACVVTYKNGAELISDVVAILHNLGDVNADGKIDQYDYILVKRHYFETRLLTEGEMTRADANKDGKVDQFDYILIARHYFGTFVIK